MKSRYRLKDAKADFIVLMRQISQSHDAINAEERDLAKRVSASDHFEFESLDNEEIDLAINLLGYYWGYSGERTEIMIDFLTSLRDSRPRPLT